MTIRIAVNRMATGKMPQGDPRWAAFNDSFVNGEREPIELANDIYLGHAYSAWMRGRRSIENFVLAQHIAIDMDSGDMRSSFDTLLRHDLVQMYGSVMHTTPSHKPEAPRARVIFFLDEPITDAAKYQTAAKFLVAQFDGADQACTDASRFFYGAYNCEIWFSDNVLPVCQLRHFYRQWAKTSKAPALVPAQVPTPSDNIIKLNEYRQERSGINLDALLDPIRSSRPGGRNSALNRQAFLAGKDIRAGKIRHDEIVPLLLAAARSVGLDDKESMTTINSGLRGGKAVG
jgi:hypothetical protein